MSLYLLFLNLQRSLFHFHLTDIHSDCTLTRVILVINLLTQKVVLYVLKVLFNFHHPLIHMTR